MKRADAADTDDGASFGLVLHQGERPLAAVQDRGQVDGDYGGQQTRRGSGAWRVWGPASIIDQHVEPAISVFDRREERVELIRFANVATHVEGGGTGTLKMLVPAAGCDGGAGFCEAANDGGSDAATSPSDKDNLAFECFTHRQFPWPIEGSKESEKEYQT
jgi:hypothetical protein